MSHEVVTDSGGLVARHPVGQPDATFDEAQATLDAEHRNKAAEDLGIKTRYEVRESK